MESLSSSPVASILPWRLASWNRSRSMPVRVMVVLDPIPTSRLMMRHSMDLPDVPGPECRKYARLRSSPGSSTEPTTS